MSAKIITISDYLVGSSDIEEQGNIRVGTVSIKPAAEEVEWELAENRTSEPIKDLADIVRVHEYLVDNGRYRDNMLFICGINFGLRISDLLRLRFCNLIDNSGRFKDSFPILEKKTANTRKHRVNRVITINDAVKNAVLLYLEHTGQVAMDDYLFKCEGNRGSGKNKPLAVYSVNRILYSIAEECGLPNKMSTHSLRKTFAYHQMLISQNDTRKLMLLQKIFGHSTVEQTLQYIGITKDEIASAYRELNLGAGGRGILDSELREDRLNII